MAHAGATGTVKPGSAEEDPAQRQDSERLPEGDSGPAEERRQQPVPQLPHDLAADGDEQQACENYQRCQENPFPSHVQFLIPS
jgi:hypothetical protein